MLRYKRRVFQKICRRRRSSVLALLLIVLFTSLLYVYIDVDIPGFPSILSLPENGIDKVIAAKSRGNLERDGGLKKQGSNEALKLEKSEGLKPEKKKDKPVKPERNEDKPVKPERNEDKVLKKPERKEALKPVRKEKKNLEKPRKKVILVYTDLYKTRPWNPLPYGFKFKYNNSNLCEVQNCRVTYDKNELEASDAVLFHAYDIIGNLSELSRSTKNRVRQRWIIYNAEPPFYFKFRHNLASLEGVFNWTINYRYTSDIIRPYYSYLPYKKEKVSEGSRNYAHGKEHLIAWVVSNCRFHTNRKLIGSKLLEYLPVHVHGKCSKKFGQNRVCKQKRKGECIQLIRKYKFYLAFENSFCVDYVTEKYWGNSLQLGAIPVVLGGGDYTDKRLAIPGSYINVLDFPSLKDLANYILMLDKNDTAYNEYFRWKRYYYLTMQHFTWPCHMCAKLNNDSLPVKTYANGEFEQFFSETINCFRHEDKVRQLLSDN